MLASVGHRYTFGCFSGSFTCVHRSNLPVPGVATDPHLRLGLPACPGFISPASARRCHRLTVGSFGLHDTSSWWDLNPHRIYSYGDFRCLPPSVIASYFRAGTSRTGVKYHIDSYCLTSCTLLFNYTEWRQDLFEGLSGREISQKAMDFQRTLKKNKPA